jgi:HTH-type transcriptional regulator/antitoxin HigA
MPAIDLQQTASTWSKLSDTLFVPRTEAEYNRLVAMLDQLIDEVGEDEAHPLASFMDIIGVLIEHYENVNVPELIAS